MKETYNPLQGKSSMVVKLAMLALLSAACSNNSDNSATYTVTVSVERYDAATTGNLILQNNGGDDLTITLPTGSGTGTGPFTGTFSTRLANAATYNVTVGTQTNGLDCTVNTGGATPRTGTINNANVTVGVFCNRAG